MYEARQEGASWFDDEGLEEVCELHRAITTAPGYEDHCFRMPASAPNGTRTSRCFTGLSPLGFFYGDDEHTLSGREPPKGHLKAAPTPRHGPGTPAGAAPSDLSG